MKAYLLFIYALFAMIPLWAQWQEMPLNMTGVWGSSVNLVDYDGDGDLDIFLNGSVNPSGVPYCRIHRNRGGGLFSSVNPGFSGTYRGHSVWADFNSDGILDLVIVGRLSEATLPSSRMYLGSASGSFSLANVGFLGLDYSWVDAGDYDNDGDMDVLITGIRSGTNYIMLYRNDGNLQFSEIYAGLRDVSNGQCHWVDIDNDGDLDISVLGSGYCLIYRNEGTDRFTRLDQDFVPLSYSASAWGDFNNDGFVDLATAGQGPEGVQTYLYQNNGQGGFHSVVHNIPGRMSGSLMWGDYNNDGLLDLFITGGAYPYGPRVSSLYKNMGDRNFALQNTAITPISSSSSAFGDLDNDGRLDMVIAGYTGTSYVSKYYRNLNPATNAAPSAPSVIWDQEHSVLRFVGAMDDSTPTLGLSYNLKIGSSAGADDIFPVVENPQGYRRTVKHERQVYYFEPQPFQQYYASAQAIDHAYAGSAFGPVLQFRLQGVPMIAVLDGNQLDFGVVELGTASPPQRVLLRNTGTASLRINGVSFSQEGFSASNPAFPHVLAAGDSVSIAIVFTPLNPGEIDATMTIFSTAINAGELIVGLQALGTSLSAPAQVQNLQIDCQGADIVLSWDPVNVNEAGYLIDVDDYILIFSELQDNFWYLGHSESCSFTHPEITLVAGHLFYRVKAYKNLRRSALARLEAMQSSSIRIPWDTAKAILEEE